MIWMGSNVSKIGVSWVEQVGVEGISVGVIDGVIVERVEVTGVDQRLSVNARIVVGVVVVSPPVIGLQCSNCNQIGLNLNSSASS